MANPTSEPAENDSPLGAWLTLQCQMITGAESALVVLGDRGAARVARWPGDAEPARPLSAAVALALEQGRLAMQQVGASSTIVALPLEERGQVAGAFGVTVHGVPQHETKALVDLLRWCARGLEMLIDTHGSRARLAARLSIADRLLDHEGLDAASHALAAELASRLGCENVAVGLQRRGRLRVAALSSSLRFNEESDAVRNLPPAMQEAIDQDAVIELPESGGGHVVRAHQRRLDAASASAIRTLPLASRGECVGALLCEWTDARGNDPARRGGMDDAAVLCGPILALMARADAGPLERGRSALHRLAERYLGEDRRHARWILAAAAVLLVGLALVPARYRISARATLEGRVQRALVAAVDGYIAEANARAGDLVRAGEVLARLDDRDLRLEQRKWQSRKAQLEKEYREALAIEDRTQVSVLRAQIEQATAELGLAEEQLGRTTVTAPFDGIVLEGDLDRALGSPVDRGRVLFEVAPLDGYRIIVEVDERDIADVEVGQRGRLALSALPGRPLALAVERITPLSTAEDGRNYFRVEAVLEEPVDVLRPGMEGVAKIEAGRRRLAWIWTHELLDWLRLRTWSLLP